MAFLLLIAETPNAGNLGYRFLISPGATISDDIAAKFVSHVRGKALAVGGNYLSVGHKVPQRFTGRTDASETLVLVGVDTSRIPSEVQEQLIATLRSLLPQLEATVREIDWGHEKRFVVPHPLLGEWLSEEIRSLPVADMSEGPQDRGQTQARVEAEPDLPTKRSGKLAPRWIAASLLILFVVATVSSITGWLPLPVPHTVVDTTTSSVANPSDSDEFAAKLKEIRREVTITNDPTRLDKLKARLNDIEGGQRLASSQKREVDDLRWEIDTKLNGIKKEEADIKKKKVSYYQKIEKQIASATDPESLDKVRADLHKVPYPDKFPEYDNQERARLLKNIEKKQTELKQKRKLLVKIYQMNSKDDIETTAKELSNSTIGKAAELEELTELYKDQLNCCLTYTINQQINAKRFVDAREYIDNYIKERSSSDEMKKIVGENFFQDHIASLDEAEDKYRYERITSSTSVDEKEQMVTEYLGSRVAENRKRMNDKVEELKKYFDTLKNDVDMTLSLKSIKWPQSFTGKYAVQLSITLNEKNKFTSNDLQVTAEPQKEKSLDRPLKIDFKAKLSDSISISLKLEAYKTNDNVTFSYPGDITIAKLHNQSKSGNFVTLKDNKNQARDIEIKLEVQGIPEEPKLPEYGKE